MYKITDIHYISQETFFLQVILIESYAVLRSPTLPFFLPKGHSNDMSMLTVEILLSESEQASLLAITEFVS